jgi:hypothetical protein|tara:strand:+ start:1234 stop:1782 length:549 start_codon:yes stop_codon:yes gene_type:complete
MAEKKHERLETTGQVLTSSGFMIRFPMLATGNKSNERVGKDVNWTSYHHQIFLKSPDGSTVGSICRLICYKPKDPSTTMKDADLPTISSFINTDKYVVFSDRLINISEYGTNNHDMSKSYKILKMGNKFRSPKKVTYLSDQTDHPLSGDMHWLLVSDKGGGFGPTSGAPLLTIRSDFYYNDA